MPTQQLPHDVRLRAIISDLAYACHHVSGEKGKYSGDRAEAKLNWWKQRTWNEGDMQMYNALDSCRIAKDHCNENTVAVVCIQNERTDRETREVIIGCRGTNPWNTWSGFVGDWVFNNRSIMFNNTPGRRALTTVQNIKDIMKAFPGYQFSVTGHSLGGAVAEYASLDIGIPGTGFNGASGLMNAFMLAKRLIFGTQYTNYRTKGDVASVLHIGNTITIDKFSEFGAHTLDNFTKRRENDRNNNADPSLGGIDFTGAHVRVWSNRSIDIGSISGAVFSGSMATLLANKHANNLSTITKQDFAVALALAYIRRDPAFSLDPWEPTKPDGPWLRCVYYPEQINIVEKNFSFPFAQTDYGRTMFETDWLLKQLSMGVNLDGYTATGPFPSPLPIREFPLALRQLGFRDRFELENASSSNNHNPRYTRLWITVNREETLEGIVPPYETFPVSSMSCSQQMDLGNSIALHFSDVKLGVQVMRMARTVTGELEDVSDPRLSDPNSSDVIFARLMTDHYDQIAQYYPSLRRLKELAKLQAIAKWLLENDVHVDIDEVLKCIRETTPVAIEKVPALERQSNNVRLFGGVNLSIRQNHHDRAPNYSTLGQQNQTELKNLICQSISPPTANENGSMVIPLPFIKKKHCSICDRPLDFASLFRPSTSSNDISYCNEHHPDACGQCLLPLYVDPTTGLAISENVYVVINEDDSTFRCHRACFLCAFCETPIVDQSYAKDPDIMHVYYHVDCYSPIRSDDLRNTQRRHEMSIAADDEQVQLEMVLRRSKEEHELKHDYYQNQISFPSTSDDEDTQLAIALQLSLQTNQSTKCITNFLCPYCDNDFRTRDDFEEHKRLHFEN